MPISEATPLIKVIFSLIWVTVIVCPVVSSFYLNSTTLNLFPVLVYFTYSILESVWKLRQINLATFTIMHHIFARCTFLPWKHLNVYDVCIFPCLCKTFCCTFMSSWAINQSCTHWILRKHLLYFKYIHSSLKLSSNFQKFDEKNKNTKPLFIGDLHINIAVCSIAAELKARNCIRNFLSPANARVTA